MFRCPLLPFSVKLKFSTEEELLLPRHQVHLGKNSKYFQLDTKFFIPLHIISNKKPPKPMANIRFP